MEERIETIFVLIQAATIISANAVTLYQYPLHIISGVLLIILSWVIEIVERLLMKKHHVEISKEELRKLINGLEE